MPKPAEPKPLLSVPGASRAELERWRATAKLAGVPLADWIRQCCNAGAGGDEIAVIRYGT